MHKKILIIGSVVVVVGIAVYVGATLFAPARAVVTNFEECVAAGFPVMESHPEQCRAGDRVFVRDQDAGERIGDPERIVRDGCFVGGCSSEVCSDDPDVVTICIYRPEYVCYKRATCERQASGACGWTETPELLQCIEEHVSTL
jgi:hypothetical protein